jgi:hypothetical protein
MNINELLGRLVNLILASLTIRSETFERKQGT